MSCKSDEEFCHHHHGSVIRHFVVTERKLGVLYVHLLYLLAPDSLFEGFYMFICCIYWFLILLLSSCKIRNYPYT